MKLTIPSLSLVALIGPSGCGKSTFGAAHFLPTEVLSSDAFRAMVSDDANDQAATSDAFDVLFYIAGKRLKAGRLTVVDATNVQIEAQRKLVDLARAHHVLPVAIVLNLPEEICRERNTGRPDRDFGAHVVRNQASQLRRSLRGLRKLGFRHVYVLRTPEEVAEVEIVRHRLWNDQRERHGPFDLIGDIHGCFDELVTLLGRLGYTVEGEQVTPPEGRTAIFLGDLVDRGPSSPAVLRLVMNMVRAGTALCVPGNHDMKLVKKLSGRNVKIGHGLAETLEQLSHEPPEFSEEVRAFLDGLVSHYVLDDGNLVVAHAGMREDLQGRASGKVRDFALYGETTGESDEFGLPVRYDWARDYRGRAMVVYGHTPVPQPEWLNRTINIDTGCVFGGALTALRYPERELVSVPAQREYADPVRPLAQSPLQGDRQILAIEDVYGKHVVHTRLRHAVSISEAASAGALEIMSRYAVDPRWLIYLPPTMSPCETSVQPDYLEHPHETFAYFAKRNVGRVICQEKHMGSRALVVICRTADAARERFGVADGAIGCCYTRTGRPFFNDRALEDEFLKRIAQAVSDAGLWETLDTTWLLLDCELMPWSAKAQALLLQQYAPVGAAAVSALTVAQSLAEEAAARGVALEAMPAQIAARRDAAAQFDAAYRRYCWPVGTLDDYRLAHFHLLASEGAVHADKPHSWHLEQLHAVCEMGAPLLHMTRTIEVDPRDADSVAAATSWWLEMTEAGGEGMVAKPMQFTAFARDGLLQPGIKCRGREHLRIIYGPEYTLPHQLDRLRNRNLAGKRSLALREYALGVEALERFVNREPLYKVHAAVFAVLALETEPVDPRL